MKFNFITNVDRELYIKLRNAVFYALKEKGIKNELWSYDDGFEIKSYYDNSIIKDIVLKASKGWLICTIK